MLQATLIVAYSELDNWENGCNPDTLKTEFFEGIEFKAETKEEMLIDIKNHFNANDSDLLLNSCGEIGRIDVQIIERKPFSFASASVKTYEKFKNGAIDLWLTNYTLQVKQITDFDLV